MCLRDIKYFSLILSFLLLVAGCSTSPMSMTSSGHLSKEVKPGPNAILMQQGEYKQAIQDMERQLSRRSGMMDTRINLAIAHRALKQYSEAETQLKTVIDSDSGNAVAWHQLAILKREQGDFNESEIAYRQALKLQPDYALAHRNYGILLDIYLHQPEAALPHYRQYMALGGENPDEVERWVAELERRVNKSGSGGQ